MGKSVGGGGWGGFGDPSLVHEPGKDKASYTCQLTPHFSLCSSRPVIPLSAGEASFPKQTWPNDRRPPRLPA